MKWASSLINSGGGGLILFWIILSIYISYLQKNQDDNFYIACVSEEPDFVDTTTIAGIVGGFGYSYCLNLVLFLIIKL